MLLMVNFYTNMTIFEVRIVAAAGWADIYLPVATNGHNGAGSKPAFCFVPNQNAWYIYNYQSMGICTPLAETGAWTPAVILMN